MLTFFEEHVVLQIELSVRGRIVLHLVGQETQELSGHHLFDAAHQVAVLSFLTRQGQRQILTVHRTLEESKSCQCLGGIKDEDKFKLRIEGISHGTCNTFTHT